MNADSLIRLLDAGFTREEILQMTQGSQGGTHDEGSHTEHVESHDENQSGNQEQSGDQNQSPTDSGTAFESRISGIEKKISDLIKTIQASNVRNDHMNTAADSLEEQTDKIMAGIIRPEPVGKDGRK